jgi:hypothetical protein
LPRRRKRRSGARANGDGREPQPPSLLIRSLCQLSYSRDVRLTAADSERITGSLPVADDDVRQVIDWTDVVDGSTTPVARTVRRFEVP